MDVRQEALLMLDKRGAILDTAREVSRALKAHHVKGAAIIGGVSVVLHGHVRTTRDVDVHVGDAAVAAHAALLAEGHRWDPQRREFDVGGIPVQLVTSEQVDPPRRIVVMEGITTVSLADLINIKMQSGLSSILRAQDIADVIGLIRHLRLSAAFLPQVDRRWRPEVRKLIKAAGSI